MTGAQILQLYGAALLQLAAIGLLLAASWRLAGWLWPAPNRAERVLAAGLLFCGAAVVIVVAPGVVGLLNPWVVGLAVVALWMLVRACVPLAEPLPKLTWPAGMRWPLLLALLVALPFLVRATLWIPLLWDDLTYHNYFAAAWIQAGRVFLVDGVYPYNYLAFYPKNHELIDTFLMVIVRNDVFVKLLNLPLAVLTALAAGLLCVQLGGSQRAGWCAGVFVFTIPAMFCWVATSYVEPLLNFAILSAVFFVVRGFRAERELLWRCGLLAGLALGLAVGTKYTALYLAVLLIPIAVAVPLLRQLGWKTLLRFSGTFAAAALLTGGWWYAYNAIETGNPVYPVPFGPLNAMNDPDRPTIHESNILADFAWAREHGYLPEAWFGVPPPFENLANIFDDPLDAVGKVCTGQPSPLDDPWPIGMTEMGIGLKLFLVVPLFLIGLIFAVYRRTECGRRRDWIGAAAVVTVAAAALILLYTYLKLPIWRDSGSLYCQVRFAVPFVCLSVVLGFAAVGQTWFERTLPWLTLVGLVCDALILDLRFPAYRDLFATGDAFMNRLQSFILLLVIAGVLYLLRGVHVNPRVGMRLAVLGIIVCLLPLLSYREDNRYRQWQICREVHGGYGPDFAPAAEKLDREHAGAAIAYTGNFASYLYMFAGPRFDHSITYVSTWDGPAASHLKQGALRHTFDRAAWEKNLKTSGAKLLVSFRFCDRQLDSSSEWPIECAWAEKLFGPPIFANDYCKIHRIVFANQENYHGHNQVSQGH